MIRLGLIGRGAWGKNYIAAVRDSGNAELVWIAGRDWMSHPVGGVVDGVIIATPPNPRALIMRYMNAQLMPMMVEKPLCLSLKDVELVASKPPFLVDYVHLFSPAYERLRMMVRERPGRLEVTSVVSHTTLRDYSVLWDHAPHDLAMCLGLGLEVAEARLIQSFLVGNSGFDVDFKDSSTLKLAIGTNTKARRFQVTSGEWRAVYDGVAQTLDVNGERVVDPTEEPLTLAVRAFAKAIEDGGTDDWRFGIESSMVITKVLEDAQS